MRWGTDNDFQRKDTVGSHSWMVRPSWHITTRFQGWSKSFDLYWNHLIDFDARNLTMFDFDTPKKKRLILIDFGKNKNDWENDFILRWKNTKQKIGKKVNSVCRNDLIRAYCECVLHICRFAFGQFIWICESDCDFRSIRRVVKYPWRCSLRAERAKILACYPGRIKCFLRFFISENDWFWRLEIWEMIDFDWFWPRKKSLILTTPKMRNDCFLLSLQKMIFILTKSKIMISISPTRFYDNPDTMEEKVKTLWSAHILKISAARRLTSDRSALHNFSKQQTQHVHCVGISVSILPITVCPVGTFSAISNAVPGSCQCTAKPRCRASTCPKPNCANDKSSAPRNQRNHATLRGSTKRKTNSKRNYIKSEKHIHM